MESLGRRKKPSIPGRLVGRPGACHGRANGQVTVSSFNKAGAAIDTHRPNRLVQGHPFAMSSHSLELTAGDFDAYLPERASSNAFSRPRLEFKQRALGWARQVVDRLQAIDIPMDVHASDEHPSVRNGHRVDCQWVFFWRSLEQRQALDALLDQRAGIAEALRDPSPYFRHAFLALRLDSEKIEVCAQLHPDAWVDFEAFRARLASDQGAEAIVNALLALPEQFQFGISGRTTEPVATASTEALRDLVGRVRTEGAAFWVGWTVTRGVALEHLEILDEQLEDALAALGPVYQHLAWRKDDDTSGLSHTLESMRAELAQAAARRAESERKQHEQSERLRQEQTERSRERTRERVEYDTSRARPTLATLFKPASPAAPNAPPAETDAAPKPVEKTLPVPPAALPHGRDAAPSRPRDKTPRPAKTPRHQEVSAPPRRPAPPPTFIAGGAIDKGAQVRVLSGPFAGKVGVIGEVDGRGGARVLLGLLSTRLLTEQLEAVVEAKDRPSIQSSHRKNGLLGRSGK